jgi:uncharacterized protein with PIN domain
MSREHPAGSAGYLVRFHEAGRDGQPQRQGLRRDLLGVITSSLPSARLEVLAGGRILVEGADAAELLASLPGVSSFSPGWRVSLESLEAAVVALASRIVVAGGSFAVRVRRVGDQLFRSRELAARLGGAVGLAVPGARVDLAAPDVTIGVEVRGEDCFLFHEVVHGLDRRGRPARPGGEARFLADQMLGRLAVWLRLCGFDTADGPDRPDSWLLRRARDEGRILLTRDRALSRSGSASCYFVGAREVEAQLDEVIRSFALHIDRARLLSRCTRCNCLIEPVPLDLVVERVPPSVRERQRSFFRCPSCDRVYWEGDHCQRILDRLSAHVGAG